MTQKILFVTMLSVAFSAFLIDGADGQVTWDTPGSGNWQDGANWSTGNVPQPTDDVVINQGGGFLVTIGATIPSINSINSIENIAVTGGDLVMANGGTISGSLILGTNLDLSSNGGTFTASGVTVLDGGNVFADSATMNLSSVTSYLTDTGTNASRFFRGRNGSSIDLSGMTDLTGGGFIRSMNFQAQSGSSIDVSALNNYLGGTSRFEADGVGSSINMSSLTTLADTNASSNGWLEASNGGSINASALTSISAASGGGVRFIVDGASSSIAANLTDVVNTRLQLLNGGAHDFSGITNFFGSDAVVTGGSTMDLTGVTSYDVNGGGNGSRVFSADGAGSIVDLSNVSTIVGGSFIRKLDTLATNGGVIDLSSAIDISSGAATMTADGAGSLIDLSSMQTFNDDNGAANSFMLATNGGEIRLDSSAASNLSFNGVNITIDGSGVIDTSRLVNYTGGTFTVDGVNQSLSLSDATNSSFVANAGANIDISSLSGTVQNTGSNFTAMNYEANGSGSLVNLSNVTELSFNTSSVNPSFGLLATGGGTVNASGIQTLNASGGIINSSRVITVSADGAGSSIELTGLMTFSDTSSVTESAIIATNGGQVDLGTNALDLTNVNLMVDTGGTILGGTLNLVSVNTNNSGAPDDLSTLSGNGTISADILNTSGVIAAGNSPGSLTIDGDFTQLTNGVIEIEIDSLALFDTIAITGDATFGGMLDVTLDPGFDLQDGQSFEIISVDGNRSGFFDGLDQNSILLSDNGFDLRIDYFGGDGNDVRLFANAIPEPGSFGLLGLLGIVCLARRRRV